MEHAHPSLHAHIILHMYLTDWVMLEQKILPKSQTNARVSSLWAELELNNLCL